jgi:hypothetical protein
MTLSRSLTSTTSSSSSTSRSLFERLIHRAGYISSHSPLVGDPALPFIATGATCTYPTTISTYHLETSIVPSDDRHDSTVTLGSIHIPETRTVTRKVWQEVMIPNTTVVFTLDRQYTFRIPELASGDGLPSEDQYGRLKISIYQGTRSSHDITTRHERLLVPHQDGIATVYVSTGAIEDGAYMNQHIRLRVEHSHLKETCPIPLVKEFHELSLGGRWWSIDSVMR